MSEAAREVFISHSRADAPFVENLIHELEKSGVSYWSDTKVSIGAGVLDEIESAVRRAAVFVLIISQNFAMSEYALFKAGIAMGRAQASGARIVPILLPGASLPQVLRGFQVLRADSLTNQDIVATIKAAVAAVIHKPELASRELRVFVSSPSDVASERECVSRIVEELNATVGITNGIKLQRYAWEYEPTSLHRTAQQIISDELSRTDIFLLILASRVGSMIGGGQASAVEEEFETAIDHYNRQGKPRVLCFLKTAPVPLRSIEQIDQAKRLLDFRDRLRRDLIVHEYELLSDFETKVREQLIKIIQSQNGRTERN